MKAWGKLISWSLLLFQRARLKVKDQTHPQSHLFLWPFHSIPVQSISFHHSSPPNPYTLCEQLVNACVWCISYFDIYYSCDWVKRTVLFGEFLRINAAFDWSTAWISCILPTAHCRFTLKPADARHFAPFSRCKMRWHAGHPSVTIANSGITNVEGQQWLKRSYVAH